MVIKPRLKEVKSPALTGAQELPVKKVNITLSAAMASIFVHEQTQRLDELLVL